VSQNVQDTFSKEQQEVLRSIRVSRIILPIIIGLVVVGYLLWKNFDPKTFAEINWNAHAWTWISASIGLLIIRHLSYALRLRILSEKQFSWSKCIELIFIWEFSSAISPTAVGGTAVALFVLAQEKLSAAKVATIVIYSAVLDTLFFVGTLPIYLFYFGPAIIRPGLSSFDSLDKWGYTFLFTYVFMAIYGSLFFYGLFINPQQIKRLLVGITKLSFLKRYQQKALQLGDDIVVASGEIWRKKWLFHVSAFLSTAGAWSCRFLLVNCLIIGIVNVPLDFMTQGALYARLQTMFVIMAFSPTPGGVGFAEVVFGGFLTDYVPSGIAPIIAFIWRFLTYYLYLLVGAIIIPNWIRNVINRRKKAKVV